MSQLKQSAIRTSLAVGFADGMIPDCYRQLVGRIHRNIPAAEEFPFEDRQFEVVIMDGAAVSRTTVKEAHRVLLPSGRLHFRLPARGKGAVGFSLPEIYALVRDGYNIVGLERTPWWRFWTRERTLGIVAEKKNWKLTVSTYRPYV